MNKTPSKLEIFRQVFGLDSKKSSFQSEDYLHAMGAAKAAILYSALFQPEFICIEDSILLAWNVRDEVDRDRFRMCLQEKKYSLEETEASFNFVEIGYIFGPQGRDTNDIEDELLAEIINSAWEAWLAYCYPERKFNVSILTPEVTGSTVAIQFNQVRE